jgi:uncharacterized 2Fe-2S/4Fe-4S cluster protein (DUF4445 family)
MNESFEVTFINQGYSKRYPKDTSLLEVIRAENLPLPFICNGEGTCGKCRVKLVGTQIVPNAAERRQISPEDLAIGYRLACQIKLTGPLQLELAEEQNTQAILHQGLLKIDRIDPLWGQIIIDRPDVFNWQQIESKLTRTFIPSIHILQRVAQLQIQPQNHPRVILEYFQNRIIDLYPFVDKQDQNHPKYGVAIDIGTTTLAAYLVDLRHGQICRTASAYNPQIRYGADVISRIQYASAPEGLERLHQLLLTALNQLMLELVKDEGISLQNIIQLNLVGNSCMAHLLMNVNPAGLGQAPFEPVFKQMLEFDPLEIGITVHPQARTFLFPGIGGFIGSDISAGVLACGLTPKRKELFIDIGTNCEMVLSGCGKMIGCSTAAGPAFEGATIACGMIAKPGAITDIVLDGENLAFTTINGEIPIGICGTGLVRIMVELLKKGIIDENGGFSKQIRHPMYDQDARRFYIVRNSSKLIYISQQDVRQFQLAKGAIRCGIELMLKRLEFPAEEFETVYLAGAFGTYLNPEDAIYLGILPPISPRKIKPVGNTAGTGGVLGLVSQTAFNGLGSLIQGIEHVELANDPEFTEKFMEAMIFENAKD